MRLKTLILTFFSALACLVACNPGELPAPTAIPTLKPSATNTAQPSPSPSKTPTATATPIPISALCSPLADHELARIMDYVSHAYREPPRSNPEEGHHGVDFSYFRKDGTGGPIDGTPIQSIFAGRVAGVGFDRLPYGNMLVIETGYENLPLWVRELFQMQPETSLYLLYAHLIERPLHSIGQVVTCGEVLGGVGNTGFSGNPHLHLETRVGPTGIDLPTMIFYDTTATLEQQAAYVEWRSGETWTKFDPTPLLEQAGAQQ